MEVPKFDLEKIEKKIAEMARYEDELPQEIIEKRANNFLNDIDLTINDLKKIA